VSGNPGILGNQAKARNENCPRKSLEFADTPFKKSAFFSNNNNKITTTKKPCSENLFKSWLKLLLRKRSRKHPQKRGKLPLQTFERALYSVFA